MSRPDTWSVFSRGKGLGEEKIESLYGNKLSSTSNAPRAQEGIAAVKALRTYLAANVYEGSDRALQAAFPPLYKPAMLRQRAVLLKAPLGGYYPVAHVGPDGFVLLTEQQARDSVRGRSSQVSPPGGFGGGTGTDFEEYAIQVTQALSHPTPRAILTLLGAVATIAAFVKVLRRL